MVIKKYRETITQKSTKVILQNILYEDLVLKVWGTAETDKRIMSFVDILWGFEVTGGIDQFEPLTVIAVKRSGLARRAGIRINDIITKINTTPAMGLTLKEAQLLIRESGKHVKIYVTGDDDEESDDELTVDFWFTPPSKEELDLLEWERRRRANRNPGKWSGAFPWNDRNKPIYKESNCYMVESKHEVMIRSRSATPSILHQEEEEEHNKKSLSDTFPSLDQHKGR